MLTAARRALRRVVPVPLRQVVALARRRWRNRGMVFAARAAISAEQDWPVVCAVRQDIRQSQHWQGKLHNLKLAASLIDGATLAPGAVLSLWALLGQPSAPRGYAVGRAIRADAEVGDVGGGLCQLSGLIYELGLRAGLEAVERHPHSRDLYSTEEDRFTPLGLDATVVWPWKDMQLRNPHDQPLRLRCVVEELELSGALLAASPIAQAMLRIDRSDRTDGKHVAVWRSGPAFDEERISLDLYR